MRYAQIRSMDVSNGSGIGVALFTQGCPYHCKNCFNPETWDFDKGTAWTKENEEKILKLLEPAYIDRLSILGGEPLIERNIDYLTELCKKVKELYPNKKIWLYTGGNFEHQVKMFPLLFSYLDIVIDGRYIDELRDMNLKWRGSSNQRVIDVKKSLEEGKVILMEV